MVHNDSKVGYSVLRRERITRRQVVAFLMFVAVMGRRRFAHTLATTRCVGPSGAVAVQFRTEEPGEQRFCEDQRLKQPMGLPFSEWADFKILPGTGRIQGYGRSAFSPYLIEITVDRPSFTNDSECHRRRSTFKIASLSGHLQQTSTAFSSNIRESQDRHLV